MPRKNQPGYRPIWVCCCNTLDPLSAGRLIGVDLDDCHAVVSEVAKLQVPIPESLSPSTCNGAAWPALILGGQKSGKSKRAELCAKAWLAQDATHRAIYVATGQAWDAEMQSRIARHQRDRALRVPGLATVEAPLHLAQALQQYSNAQTLLVVDCLTMWLTNWLMPMPDTPPEGDWSSQRAQLLSALAAAPGPVVVVGNEIGWGVIPMGAQVRHFVDSLGALNQDVAAVCQSVTLMAAGLPMVLK